MAFKWGGVGVRSRGWWWGVLVVVVVWYLSSVWFIACCDTCYYVYWMPYVYWMQSLGCVCVASTPSASCPLYCLHIVPTVCIVCYACTLYCTLYCIHIACTLCCRAQNTKHAGTECAFCTVCLLYSLPSVLSILCIVCTLNCLLMYCTCLACNVLVCSGCRVASLFWFCLYGYLLKVVFIVVLYLKFFVIRL